MHGEFKVPGGKLVVVDLSVTDGRLADVRLSGDFFLEPDEALPAIDAALTGLPVGADARTIAAAVTAALPEGTTMLGFSAEAVATAVRRALQRATTWADYEWEIVRPGPLSPLMHLALDQVLAEEVGDGRRKPTLRFWEWASPAVVIGSFQSVKNEVDPENAQKYGFPVVRRISGGGAMFIEPPGAVTYSIYAPVDLVQGMSFADSYAFFDEFAVQALRDLGIEASYVPLNDIASPQGKIGGAAQKRLGNGGVLHHVTMAYDMDGDRMAEVLRIGREKLSDKGTKSANKRVDPLRSQTGLSREEIIEKMIGTFRSLHGLTEGALTEGALTEFELERARELVETKFGTDEWLYRVP